MDWSHHRRWSAFGPSSETLLKGPVQRVAHIVRQLAEELRKTDCAEASACRPVNCLLVEDDENDALLSLEAIGSVGGVIATLAKTGESAVQMLNEAQAGDRPLFDIVFIDLQLNGSEVQGQQLIERIRQQFPKTHTVIISGHLGQAVLDSLRGGYVGVVQKPLERDNLTEILAKHRMRND